MEGDENLNEGLSEKAEKEVKKKEYLRKRMLKKGKSENGDDRIPPGQKLSKNWQILDLGEHPEMDLDTWKLRISYKGKSKQFSLDDIKKLGVQKYKTDFHCVTTWSKLDMDLTGVPFSKILKASADIITDDDWKFIIQTGKDGYTTNAPRSEFEHEDVFLAFEFEDSPITREHGYVRIIIPQLYGWKSAKFLQSIELREEDAPGFWEVRGYSNVGDVWSEDRFSSTSD